MFVLSGQLRVLVRQDLFTFAASEGIHSGGQDCVVIILLGIHLLYSN